MTLCTRCHAHRRMAKQRWCRACFTEYRRRPRAKRKAEPPDIQPAQQVPPLVRFWCQKRGLSLKIDGVGLVRFQDGPLETADSVVIEAVRRNDWYGGIIQEGEQPPPPPARPTLERPRAYPPLIPKRVLGDW